MFSSASRLPLLKPFEAFRTCALLYLFRLALCFVLGSCVTTTAADVGIPAVIPVPVRVISNISDVNSALTPTPITVAFPLNPNSRSRSQPQPRSPSQCQTQSRSRCQTLPPPPPLSLSLLPVPLPLPLRQKPPPSARDRRERTRSCSLRGCDSATRRWIMMMRQM